jgi:ribonuclease HI
MRHDPLSFEALCDAAYHGERVASRRLARRDGLPEARALLLTLEQVAGPAGLAALLAVRSAQRQADAQRQAAKTALKAAALANKKTAWLAPAGAWVGWFDGSALPNPGRIAIGALLTGPAGERIEISRRDGYGNSGEAEYAALLALLEAALPLAPALLVIHGDSRVIIDDLHLAEADGAAGLETQRAQARALLAQLPSVTLRWVPRHRNSAADRLAGLAHLTNDDTNGGAQT